MTDQKEAGSRGPQLPELYGAEVDSIEIEGGSKFARSIMIRFKDGKTLWIKAQIDVGSYGVLPRVEYGVGGWGTILTNPN